MGSIGDAATTSFFPAKPLGCYGDGGAGFTNDDGLAELLRSLSMHGQGDDRYDNVRVGLNSRLDTDPGGDPDREAARSSPTRSRQRDAVAKRYNDRLCRRFN